MTTKKQLPTKDAPLSVEEFQAAADIFFPLYNVVSSEMAGAKVEDILKVMENLAKLAHRERAKAREESIKLKFGFNRSNKEDNEKENDDDAE
tara:strand:- start:4004 stop:4279 length:276 start_codon:yes stop_codon:yes gene_type:complete